MHQAPLCKAYPKALNPNSIELQPKMTKTQTLSSDRAPSCPKAPHAETSEVPDFWETRLWAVGLSHLSDPVLALLVQLYLGPPRASVEVAHGCTVRGCSSARAWSLIPIVVVP